MVQQRNFIYPIMLAFLVFASNISQAQTSLAIKIHEGIIDYLAELHSNRSRKELTSTADFFTQDYKVLSSIIEQIPDFKQLIRVRSKPLIEAEVQGPSTREEAIFRALIENDREAFHAITAGITDLQILELLSTAEVNLPELTPFTKGFLHLFVDQGQELTLLNYALALNSILHRGSSNRVIDVLLQSSLVEYLSRKSIDVVQLATFLRDKWLVRRLIANGVAIDGRSGATSYNALHWAIIVGDEELVRIFNLLSLDVNSPGRSATTSAKDFYCFALKNGDYEIFEAIRGSSKYQSASDVFAELRSSLPIATSSNASLRRLALVYNNLDFIRNYAKTSSLYSLATSIIPILYTRVNYFSLKEGFLQFNPSFSAKEDWDGEKIRPTINMIVGQVIKESPADLDTALVQGLKAIASDYRKDPSFSKLIQEEANRADKALKVQKQLLSKDIVAAVESGNWMPVVLEWIMARSYAGLDDLRDLNTKKSLMEMRIAADDDSFLSVVIARKKQWRFGVNHIDEDGQTYLGYAARYGSLRCLAILLRDGAEVNLADMQGYTPLMHAAEAGQKEAVQALLQANANVHAKNKDGRTSLALAWDKDILSILRKTITASYAGSLEVPVKSDLNLAIQMNDCAMVKAILGNEFIATEKSIASHLDLATAYRSENVQRYLLKRVRDQLLIRDYARAAEAAYSSNEVPGYQLQRDYAKQGLHASYYYSAELNEGIIAFRGDEVSTAADLTLVFAEPNTIDLNGVFLEQQIAAASRLLENMGPFAVAYVEQKTELSLKAALQQSPEGLREIIIESMVEWVKEAVQMVTDPKKRIFPEGTSIRVTGYSFGGLMAQVASQLYGYRGAAFNAPDIGFYYPAIETKILLVRHQGDVVSWTSSSRQNGNVRVIAEPGNRVELLGPATILADMVLGKETVKDLFKNHSMAALLKVLEAEDLQDLHYNANYYEPLQ